MAIIFLIEIAMKKSIQQNLKCRYSIDEGELVVEEGKLCFYRDSFGEHVLSHSWDISSISSISASEGFLGVDISA